MANNANQVRATFAGLTAIVLWSSVVGFLKSISQSFGATGGPALVYTIATVILIALFGVKRSRHIPRAYLLWGGLLFVSYELCMALSISYSTSPQQAVEVAMVNYLWPTFTVIGAVLLRQQRASRWIYLGLGCSLVGIATVLGGDGGNLITNVTASFFDNPLSFGLSLAGAVVWAAYCLVTPRIANGHNGVVLFFGATAAVLWIKLGFTRDITLVADSVPIGLLIITSAAMGLGYAAWNFGILHGNVSVLASASYFTPVLAAGLAAFVLQTSLSWSFWQGALMICIGSTICWCATRQRPKTQFATGN